MTWQSLDFLDSLSISVRDQSTNIASLPKSWEVFSAHGQVSYEEIETHLAGLIVTLF